MTCKFEVMLQYHIHDNCCNLLLNPNLTYNDLKANGNSRAINSLRTSNHFSKVMQQAAETETLISYNICSV